MQKCDRYPHQTRVVFWYILSAIHIDAVTIVIFRIFVFVSNIFFYENNIFVSLV